MLGKRFAVVAALFVAAGTLGSAETAALVGAPNVLDGVPLCGIEASASDRPTLPDDGVLKVSTFNVLHSETVDGDVSLGDRLPLLADAIVASAADIVGAQEVTRNIAFDPGSEAPQKHGLVAQRLAAAIAFRTGESWHWCWSRSNPHVPLTPDVAPGGGNPLDDMAASMGNFPDAGDFSEGIAILSRFPISSSRFRRLPPRSYEVAACTSFDPFCPLDAVFDSRQVLWGRVQSPGGGIDMFTTHLAHGLTTLSDTTKLIQMKAALAIVDAWATPDALPDFLVGDFNSVPGSAVLNAATGASFADTYAAAGGTDCVTAGAAGCSGGPPDGDEVYSASATRPMSERIDYVMARPPSTCALAVPDSDVIGNTATALPDGSWLWPSDHLGFTSTITC